MILTKVKLSYVVLIPYTYLYVCMYNEQFDLPSVLKDSVT